MLNNSAPSVSAPVKKYTALQDVLSDAAGVMSHWPHVRDQYPLNAHEAFDLLAAWNHLRRFPADKLDDKVVKELDQLVHRELRHLTSLVLKHSFSAEAWLKEAMRLHNFPIHLLTEDQMRELKMNIHEHFCLLDEHSLAADALYCLIVPSPTVSVEQRDQINNCVGETLKAEYLLEYWLEENSIGFVFLGPFAQEEFQEYRTDLITFDARLWRITLKYRLVFENWLVSSQQSLQPPECYDRPFDNDREAYWETLKPTLRMKWLET